MAATLMVPYVLALSDEDPAETMELSTSTLPLEETSPSVEIELAMEEEEELNDPTITVEQGITLTRKDEVVDSFVPSLNYWTLIEDIYGMVQGNEEDTSYLLYLCEVYEAQRNLKIQYDGSDYEQTHFFQSDHSLEDIDLLMNPPQVEPEEVVVVESSQSSHTPWMNYTEEDVLMLARVIYGECGASWCTDYHQLCTGSVVLNRLASGLWGNSLYSVIHAPGQYTTANNLTYDQRTYQAAKQLLEYGPVLDSDVMYQANFKQGSEVVEVFSYPGHGTTYICRL
jgi:hypothetical protein